MGSRAWSALNVTVRKVRKGRDAGERSFGTRLFGERSPAWLAPSSLSTPEGRDERGDPLRAIGTVVFIVFGYVPGPWLGAQ